MLAIIENELKSFLPFLDTRPISKPELIARFRASADLSKAHFQSLLNLLYMLRFREICRTSNNEVLIAP